jgi:drug/metabolite transporter (DMT)-like permease
MNPYALIAALVTVGLVIVGQTLLKRGMNVVGPIGRVRLRSPGRLLVDMVSRWQLWAGTVLYAASAAAWVLALSTAAPALAYPFLCLSYFGVALTAVLVLGEKLTPAQWLGVLLVIAGVAVVTLSG